MNNVIITVNSLEDNSKELKYGDLVSLNIADSLAQPLDITIVESHLIITDPTSNSHLTFLNLLKSGDFIKLFPHGKGPNEYGLVIDIKYTREDSIIYFFDGMKANIRGYNFYDLIKNGNRTIPKKTIEVGQALKFDFLHDSFIASTGLGPSRLNIMRRSDGKLLVGLYDRPIEKYYANENSYDYSYLINNQACINIDDNSKVIYLTYTQKPLIEGYQAKGESMESIAGAWSLSIENSEIARGWEIPQARFIKSQIVNRQLFALYSDNLDNQYVVCIDPMGRLQMSYKITNIKVHSFAIDPKSMGLYLLAEDENYVTEIYFIPLRDKLL